MLPNQHPTNNLRILSLLRCMLHLANFRCVHSLMQFLTPTDDFVMQLFKYAAGSCSVDRSIVSLIRPEKQCVAGTKDFAVFAGQ
jgi:hypothetical protein